MIRFCNNLCKRSFTFNTVGLDLGTRVCRMALLKSNRLDGYKIDESDHNLFTAVYLDKDGRRMLGVDYKDTEFDFHNCAYDLTRFLGADFNDLERKQLNKKIKQNISKTDEGDAYLHYNNKKYRPSHILS